MRSEEEKARRSDSVKIEVLTVGVAGAKIVQEKGLRLTKGEKELEIGLMEELAGMTGAAIPDKKRKPKRIMISVSE